MNVTIIGLGLIGGSMAMAYHKKGHHVAGYDIDNVTVQWAKLAGVIDEELTDPESLRKSDLILLAIGAADTIKWLEENSGYINRDALVIDLCGDKRTICEKCFPLAEKYGYTFAGGHPMAGTEFSGIKHAKAGLFENQPMVIVPPKRDDIALFDRIKKALTPAGFGRYSFTTAEEHDEMIAFTSQLAHVVSNAYVKSPRAQRRAGISAGSYRDLTRVAKLNPKMWTELFMENKDNLSEEIDNLVTELLKYKEAMANNDSETLERLLREGSEAKETAG